MNSPINAVVIDSDVDSRKKIVDSLKTAEGAVRVLAAGSDLQDGLHGFHPVVPHIIIMEVRDLDLGAKEVGFLVSRYPQCAVLVSCAGKDTEWILRLFRAGAREYLTRPLATSELIEAVKKVVKFDAAKTGVQAQRGEIISVYHPSGGMGVTTIAVNLAAALAAQGHNTALVDLNLFSGDVSAFLDLNPRYTLASMLPKAGQLDASIIKSIMTPHSSGVQVMDSPAKLGEAKQIQPELVKEVMGVLRTVFDYIVIDCGGPLYGCNLTALNSSDHVLFITVLDLPALKNGKRCLAAIDAECYASGKVNVVVNRYIPKDDIKLSDAEKVLGVKAYHTLPNCYADVRSSVFKGVPLVLSHPKSPFAKGLEQLAKQLSEEKETTWRSVAH